MNDKCEEKKIRKKKSGINLTFLNRNEGLVLEHKMQCIIKNNIFYMQANGVVEELCGIWNTALMNR